MFKDPTQTEMMEKIKHGVRNLVSSFEEVNTDALIAIHWYASQYHGGQDSNLYSVLSNSPYNPKHRTFRDDMEEYPIVNIMYRILEARFGKAEGSTYWVEVSNIEYDMGDEIIDYILPATEEMIFRDYIQEEELQELITNELTNSSGFTVKSFTYTKK